jgi:hypothetical protein
MLLYHYCSNQSFLSVIQNREIWASELSMSNDHLEGRWVRQVFTGFCTEKSVATVDLNQLLVHLDGLISLVGAAGFCLSEEGDLLSQWRGYADDGAGINIGFSPQYLERLEKLEQSEEFSVALRKVTYDPLTQKQQIISTVETILNAVTAGAFRSRVGSLLIPTSDSEKKSIEESFRRLSFGFLQMFPYLYTLKNPAFQEEREWRLLSYVTRPPTNMDAGDLPKMDFRAKPDRIVPIRRVALPDLEIPAIVKVTLGPRNITPEQIIAAALFKYGFKDVEVSRSEASYR